ncbi:MAG: TonB-dependent receptor [Candidatus Omnitrophica bacterium]|nr:TonB-dependent receptor [Candidatus Omnitrophota bacterium]
MSLEITEKDDMVWFKSKLFFAVFSLLFVIVQVSFAEEKSAATYQLGTVFVTEEEYTWGLHDVILQDKIGQIRSSRTADGLLGDIAGIDLKRTSPGGDHGSAVTIRGFDESRCLILLDGRPLNAAGVYGGDYVDWSSLSTEDIERIEVTRGAKSAEYGNTLGGVINIITKRGTKEPKTQARFSYGTFETMEGMLSHSATIKDFFSYSISAGHWQTDGYLRNNDVDRNNFAGKLTFLLPDDLSIGFGARHTIHKRGFIVENKPNSVYYDGSYPESDEDAGGGPNLFWWAKPGPFGPVNPIKYWGDGSYWKNIRGQYDVEAHKSFGSLGLKLQAYLNTQERTEYFYAIDNRDKLVLERFSEPENTWGWLLKATQSVNAHSFVYGAEGVYLGYGGQNINYLDNSYFRIPPSSYEGADKQVRRHSAFVQDKWAVRPSLDLNLGLRYDHYLAKESEDVKEQGVSPKLGVMYKIWEGGRLEANVGRAYRFPTSPESYWYFAGFQPPARKSLASEDGLQTEIGLFHSFQKKANVGIRAYYYDVEDYIRTIWGYTPGSVVYNIDEVALSGIEIEGEYFFGAGFSLFANYTHQQTRKKGDILDMSLRLTDELTELPENKASAGLRYRASNGTSADLTLRYVGKRSVLTGSLAVAGASSLEEINGFVTAGLHFTYPIFKKDRFSGKLHLGIENIFDEDYEEVNGFPMPGITVTGGVSVEF